VDQAVPGTMRKSARRSRHYKGGEVPLCGEQGIVPGAARSTISSFAVRAIPSGVSASTPQHPCPAREQYEKRCRWLGDAVYGNPINSSQAFGFVGDEQVDVVEGADQSTLLQPGKLPGLGAIGDEDLVELVQTQLKIIDKCDVEASIKDDIPRDCEEVEEPYTLSTDFDIEDASGFLGVVAIDGYGSGRVSGSKGACIGQVAGDVSAITGEGSDLRDI